MRAKPKKYLGQNFLIDANIRNKIIMASHITQADIILEIGSGRGELTELFSKKAKKVYAVEIDKTLAEGLKDKFRHIENIDVLTLDILKLNFEDFFQPDQKIKVIGNIPYYITSPIIERLLSARRNISVVYLTVQKEFAERIVAHAGEKEYGSFSCFVQYYAQARILFTIKNTCFYPQPKIDSSFIELLIRNKPAVILNDERLFFEIIRAAFNQRRKTLRSSLKKIPFLDLESFFTSNNIDPNVRPQELSLEEFSRLCSCMKKDFPSV